MWFACLFCGDGNVFLTRDFCRGEFGEGMGFVCDSGCVQVWDFMWR